MLGTNTAVQGLDLPFEDLSLGLCHESSDHTARLLSECPETLTSSTSLPDTPRSTPHFMSLNPRIRDCKPTSTSNAGSPRRAKLRGHMVCSLRLQVTVRLCGFPGCYLGLKPLGCPGSSCNRKETRFHVTGRLMFGAPTAEPLLQPFLSHQGPEFSANPTKPNMY